jgi:hypothetical protein
MELLMPPKDYMTIRIEPELREKITKIANEQHRSFSAQARMMLIKSVKDIENAERN